MAYFIDATATLDHSVGAVSRRAEDRYLWRCFYAHSRTFSLAARLLPPALHLPIATVYLFCRTVDSIADQRVLEVGSERALAELGTLRRRLDATLAGRSSDDLLWRRLLEVHRDFELDRRPFYELIDGAAWDLENRRIETQDDLITYANLVGGSIGALLLPFLAEGRDRAALEPAARSLGIAMQITNILRDVGEDLDQLGRVYLPADALARHGLSPSCLRRADGAPYAALMEELMEVSETYYDVGFSAMDALPLNVRLGIRAAGRMYREILNEVRRIEYENLTQRAYVPLPTRLRLSVADGYASRKARLRAGGRAP